MLGPPVDPAATRLEFAVHDQEYYVEMLLDAAAPVALLDAPPSCRVTVAEYEAQAYYFGMVFPQMILLACCSRCCGHLWRPRPPGSDSARPLLPPALGPPTPR